VHGDAGLPCNQSVIACVEGQGGHKQIANPVADTVVISEALTAVCVGLHFVAWSPSLPLLGGT
jgi:hypothetical protein